MNDNEALAMLPGLAKRHENWDELTVLSSLGRRTTASTPNYRLLKAATCIDATPAARLLLVHLIGYLGPDDEGSPMSRFVVFPGNTRLSDELRCSVRSVQRQADELEGLGMMRRCYNGMNRRIGFDLTPFAMKHGAIVAEICSIHTRRRIEADSDQLELVLVGDGIRRPNGMSAMSSRDDACVAHNRTTEHPVCSGADIVDFLRSIDPMIISDVPRGALEGFDRTEDLLRAASIHATSRFSHGGRTSSLAWASAVSSIGVAGAVGLYAIASADPKRHASIERYFSWLLRMANDPKGSDAVRQAGARAAAAHSRTTLADPATTAPSRRMPERIVEPARNDPGIGSVDDRDDDMEILPLCEASSAPEASGPCSDAAARTRSKPTEFDLWEPMGPPGPPRARDAGARMRNALRTRVGDRLFAAWLEKAAFVVDGDTVRLRVRGAFAAAWIANHMARDIESALAEVAPHMTAKVENMGMRAVG